MKTLFAIVAVTVALANPANAQFIPGFERPEMLAELSQVSGQALPLARTLSLNTEDGSKLPTSFTLVEDTGIRCITAPCPSEKTTEFRISHVSASIHNSDVIRYEAVEVLKNIPANVRIARRQLFVTESSMELVAPGGHGFMRRTIWEVEVVSFPNITQVYQGYPKMLSNFADSDLN